MEQPKKVINKEDIKQSLQATGLKAGALVKVHSGMKEIGWLEKGEDTVLEALLETIGPQGTLVMPTYTALDQLTPENCNEPFEQTRCPVWTGRIPVRFSRYPGVVRDRHPLWSNTYCGPLARELAEINEREIYGYGKEKVHWHMSMQGGSTMLLACSFKSCSAMYVPYDVLEFPHRRFIKQRQGISVERYLRLTPREQWDLINFQPDIAAKKAGFPKLARIAPFLRQAGVLREAPVGNSKIMHVALPDLYQVMFDHARKNPRFLFDDDPEAQNGKD